MGIPIYSDIIHYFKIAYYTVYVPASCTYNDDEISTIGIGSPGMQYISGTIITTTTTTIIIISLTLSHGHCQKCKRHEQQCHQQKHKRTDDDENVSSTHLQCQSPQQQQQHQHPVQSLVQPTIQHPIIIIITHCDPLWIVYHHGSNGHSRSPLWSQHTRQTPLPHRIVD